jgi:hypothetical protein
LTLVVPSLILIVCILVVPAFADPAPPPPRQTKIPLLLYADEVLVAEGVAWLIGSALLWNLLKKKQKEITMSDTFRFMLLVMAVSFLIGLVFWIWYGFV